MPKTTRPAWFADESSYYGLVRHETEASSPVPPGTFSQPPARRRQWRHFVNMLAIFGLSFATSLWAIVSLIHWATR